MNPIPDELTLDRTQMNQRLPDNAWSLEEIRQVCLFACLLAMGILLNVTESLILPRGFPVRLGLANLSILCGLYLLRWQDLFLLVAFRVLVTSLLFGSFFQLSMWLALAGGFAGVAMMAPLFYWGKGTFSIIGVSLMGSAAHMSAQIGVFAVLFAPAVLRLYAAFLALAILSGLVIGILMLQIERRILLQK